MKKHMSGWKVFFIVMGVLFLIGAAGSLLMVQFAAVGACIAAALCMFMTASVCAWMDDLLLAVSRRPARTGAEADTMSTAEKELRARSEASRRRTAQKEAAPTMADMYRNARENE